MAAFRFTDQPIQPDVSRAALSDASCGGYASFEGWVRDHNAGRRVERLEYEAYVPLAVAEGERIVAEAIARFGVTRAACVHRLGGLGIGELAVWVGVSAPHRAEAFAACRYIIDEVKHRVPIWKKEHYVDGASGWVNCEACARTDTHAHSSGPDYSRQVALPQVGERGQQRLRDSAVLVIGAGGLGVPVLQYLAAAGVGRLTVSDGDVVEASNLHRQPLYGPADVGQAKAQVAADRLRALNPHVEIVAHAEHATAANIEGWLAQHDLVVECSDNFATQFLVNDAAVRLARPAVFASIHQFEGQLQVYRPRADWPCLRCLWPTAPRDGLVGNCAQAGVLGPVPAALGALQASEALKLLLDLAAEAVPAVHVLDLLDLRWTTLRAARRADCDHSVRLARGASTQHGAEQLELWFDTLAEARASGLTLVDIREHWERLQDEPAPAIARHVPLSALFDGSAALPAGDRYLIVCAHGVRSLALAQQLRETDAIEAYSLAGGLAAVRP
jgi:adenylyltransferase/sulfurtransferase